MKEMMRKIIVGVLSIVAGILAGELKEKWNGDKENGNDNVL